MLWTRIKSPPAAPTMTALRATRSAIQIIREIRNPHVDLAECNCPNCAARLQVIDANRPRRVQCPACREIFQWPQDLAVAALEEDDTPPEEAREIEYQTPPPVVIAQFRNEPWDSIYRGLLEGLIALPIIATLIYVIWRLLTK